MMALTGAHTIGFNQQRNGPAEPLSPTPAVFNTDWFTTAKNQQGALRSDNFMAQNNPAIMNAYISSQAAFFNDFVRAYVKMGRQGATWKSYGP